MTTSPTTSPPGTMSPPTDPPGGPSSTAHELPSGWAAIRERARIADTAVAAAATLLAASGVIPLFSDLRWIVPAFVVVVLIGLTGLLGRAIALPLPLIPLAQALTLMLSLTALFAGRIAWGGFVPTSQAWEAVFALVRQGMLDAAEFGAPVPMFPGMILLAVGGVGAVALCVDTLFVSVRSPLLAGLPIAAMFLAPALMNGAGPPWWALPMAGIGWLLILAADQREHVRDWGGLPGSTRVRGLSAAARRAGVVTVAVAGLLAVLIPIGSGALWRSGEGTGPGAGTGSGEVVLDPLVSMRRDLVQSNDSEVLTYRTTAPDPGYLRVAALETFDGIVWRPREGRATGRDPGTPLPGDVLGDRVAADPNNRVTGGDSVSYDLSVTSLQNAYLPLPYPISDVEDLGGLGSDWRIDPLTGVAFSDGIPASGLKYRVAALDPRVQADELRAASAARGALWPQLALPSGLPPVIAQTAREVTAAAATPYDKAIALQRWFTGGDFTYSTGVRSGSDADYLAEFLDERVGYCEQFAASMAVMARTLGIPSRVIVGFTQGSPIDDTTWKVTVRDAHAWPELWFDGVGWVRFEPTPRAESTLQAPAYTRELDDALVPVDGQTSSTLPPLTLALAALVAALGLLGLGWLLAPMLVRRMRAVRRRRANGYQSAVEGAWAEIGDTAIDHGQPWSTTSTPRQVAARLSRGMPDAPREALERVRRELEQVRYGRPGGTRDGVPERSEALRSDVDLVVRELRHRVRWQDRVVAYCWPPSERRRQRSSMRFMKPDPDGLAGAGASASPSAAAGARVKAE